MSAIAKTIKTVLKSPLNLLPRDCFIFESTPDLSDNTKPVFDEMLRRGLNKQYKMVWLVYDKNAVYPPAENVCYVPDGGLKLRRYLARARAIITSNKFLLPYRSGTVSFYLDHGSPLKSTKGYYSIPADLDYVFSSSEGFAESKGEFFGIPAEKMVGCGYPRNDVFSEPPVDLKPVFGDGFRKIIVWYPTFRQHKDKAAGTSASIHSLPVIWDEKKAVEVNDCAKENGVLIVLKPHFAQDVSNIKNLGLSHLRFIDDRFFDRHHLTSYRFVGGCDALLTDYSSIYYDYTLCDRPIGLVWEDYEEYAKNPGFAVDMDYMMKGGVKIYNADDLKAFIRDVADGKDRLKEERREIRDVANCSVDGKNAERVVDFIMDHLK